MNDESQQKSVFKDDKTQKELNSPLKDNTGSAGKYKEFLSMLVGMIKDGKIDLYKPESLINHDVYGKLDEARQGKADFEAVNLLTVIREINGLYNAGFEDTYQIENLVERLKATKERLETQGGDLFII